MKTLLTSIALLLIMTAAAQKVPSQFSTDQDAHFKMISAVPDYTLSKIDSSNFNNGYVVWWYKNKTGNDLYFFYLNGKLKSFISQFDAVDKIYHDFFGGPLTTDQLKKDGVLWRFKIDGKDHSIDISEDSKEWLIRLN